MKPVELVPGQQIEGCLIEAICGCLSMQTWAMKRITYHTSAKFPPRKKTIHVETHGQNDAVLK